jgi:hypothetical protein
MFLRITLLITLFYSLFSCSFRRDSGGDWGPVGWGGGAGYVRVRDSNKITDKNIYQRSRSQRESNAGEWPKAARPTAGS